MTLAIDHLLRDRTRMIDLRAPVEFAKGAAPGAINLPILADAERHAVGLCYREQGPDAAVTLGQSLVHGALQRARVEGWQQVLQQYPQAAIYCWRGGQRTQFAAQWLHAAGSQPPCIPGGYKAIRKRCLNILNSDSQQIPWLVLGGRTGAGKTVVVNQLSCSLDLEGLAKHRGSAFGGISQPQPNQVDFENALAAHWLRLPADNAVLVLEDESRTIGRLALPQSWHQRMQLAAVVLLEVQLEQRIAHIAEEYVHQPLAQGSPATVLLNKYLHAVHRIRKRLGGAQTQAITSALTASFHNKASHDTWISLLLSGYYDPMYDYQLAKKAERVVFRGNRAQVRDWLQQQQIAYDARG